MECDIGTYKLVARDQNVERRVLVVANLLLAPKLAQDRSILDVAPVRQSFEVRYKASNFLLPVVQSRGWGNNQEWPPDVVGFRQIC